MGQNFLKQIMSQLLDDTKKMTKNREKKSKKLIFDTKKIDEKSRKKSKIIFGSELSEPNNEPTFV